MSLPHILLGMLREPCSGYDIKKRFNKGLRNFWAAELSQIYPALRKLESQGLLSSESAPSEKGPPKRVYLRTALGTDTLVQWLAAGPVVGDERQTYLAQVRFLGSLGSNANAIAFFQDLHAHMQDWLQDLEGTQQEWASKDPDYPDTLPDDAFFSNMTLMLGIRKVAVNVAWCEQCIALIRARQ